MLANRKSLSSCGLILSSWYINLQFIIIVIKLSVLVAAAIYSAARTLLYTRLCLFECFATQGTERINFTVNLNVTTGPRKFGVYYKNLIVYS